MEIKNVSDFVNYCQERRDDLDLAKTVELADKWTDFSERLEQHHGGNGQDMDKWVNKAYEIMTADGITLSQERLIQTREFVCRFWKHGEAFDTWFTSKVSITEVAV